MNFKTNDVKLQKIANKLKEIWIKHGRPEPIHGPTTEIHIDNPYWTEYEHEEDEEYVQYYNELIYALLGMMDIRNITNSYVNPIWYTQAYHEEKWDMYEDEEYQSLEKGYLDEALDVLEEHKDDLYIYVCGLTDHEIYERLFS